MDLINEYLDEQKKFTFYQCNYCEKEVYSLSDFERHCYNNGEDHRDITLKRIETNAAGASSKVKAEYKPKSINLYKESETPNTKHN